MTTYVPVRPGVNLSRHLRLNTKNGRITKVWLRQVMRSHPEWDWFNLGLDGGTYVNGADAIRSDLTLQVMDGGTTIAMINFAADDTNEYGLKAVVS